MSERENNRIVTQIFIYEAVCALVPTEFGIFREDVAACIRSIDIRDKPSKWRCIVELDAVYAGTGNISLTSFGALNALTLHRIKSQGVWAFVHKKLEKMGLTDCLRYGFPWNERVRDGVVRVNPRPSATPSAITAYARRLSKCNLDTTILTRGVGDPGDGADDSGLPTDRK